MAAIMFGSPEAKAIIEKDKELQRIAKEKAEEEAKRNSPEWIRERISSIEDEIGAMENEIAFLQDELANLYGQLRKLN